MRKGKVKKAKFPKHVSSLHENTKLLAFESNSGVR